MGCPVLHHILIPAEHPFPGTGSVHQYLIKEFRPNFCQLFRTFACNADIGDSGKFQVLKKRPGPGITDIIGHQHPPALKPGPQFRALTARRRTKVQDPVPRLYRKHGSRRHGAGFLKVIQAAVISRMLGRPYSAFIPCFTAVIESVPCPRHRLQFPGNHCPQLSGLQLSCVNPESRLPPFLKALKIPVVFIPQKQLHLCQEFLWELFYIRHPFTSFIL